MTTRLLGWFRGRPYLVVLALLLAGGWAATEISAGHDRQVMEQGLRTAGVDIRSVERTSVGFDIQVLGTAEQVREACEAARQTVASQRIANPFSGGRVSVNVFGAGAALNVRYSSAGGPCTSS